MPVRSADPDAIAEAAYKLASGEIVACPTEGVYGLACDPLSDAALAKLLNLKKRPSGKGFILVADRFESLRPFVVLEDRHLVVSLPLLPAPCTWIFPAARACPPTLLGDHETVAVRVSAHPVLAGLSAAFGGPIVSTSANPSGARPARTASEVQAYFPDGLALVLDAPLGGLAGPTEIRDARDGRIVRAAPR